MINYFFIFEGTGKVPSLHLYFEIFDDTSILPKCTFYIRMRCRVQ